MLYVCPECGNEILLQNIKSCPECGYPIDSSDLREQLSIKVDPMTNHEPEVLDTTHESVKKGNDNGNRTEKKNISKVLFSVAVVMYIVCAIMLYKGYDKMTNYHNSETYYSLNKNAYVGGDAYNYIINGTHATAFFTLSAGLMTSGAVFTLGGIYFRKK